MAEIIQYEENWGLSTGTYPRHGVTHNLSLSAPSGGYIISGVQDVIDKGGEPEIYKCECLSCHRKFLLLVDTCPSCGSVDVDYTPEYKLKLTETKISWDDEMDGALSRARMANEQFSAQINPPAVVTPEEYRKAHSKPNTIEEIVRRVIAIPTFHE